MTDLAAQPTTVRPPRTLTRQLIAGDADRRLARVLSELSIAAKQLERDVARAALVGRLGLAGGANVSGDSQKKLDVYADDLMIGALAVTGQVAGVVSEEREHVESLGGSDAPFVVAIDPLDGSSNTDVNGSTGTIFSILPRRGGSLEQDVLQPGTSILAAGYVMYGSSTLLVLSIGGQTAQGYTLDPEMGEFVLSHPELRCPHDGAYYSANLANLGEWNPGVQAFVEWAGECETPTGKPHSLRYSGALVSDVHRCLIDGGIYFYPPDTRYASGKLRLLYECAPLAYVVEAAGGTAGTGRERMLDVQPTDPHQRVPLAIGSKDLVARYDRLVAERG
jgi:fructose-1,6-bisphosphatase I